MKADRPHVSVILPVYNGGLFVSDAIESIISQSYQSWELVIIDDGSSDNSLAICQEYAKGDGRIIVLRNVTNTGLSRTMNRLVACAKGDYIAIQEQDDISLPNRLELEVNTLDSHPDIALVSGVAEWLDDSGHTINFFPGLLHKGGAYPRDKNDMVKYLYVEQCKIVNAACMFRKSVLNRFNGKPFDDNARMSIDWQFFLHLAHDFRVFGLSNVLVRMRRGNSHNSLTKKKDLQFREALRCINLIYYCYRDDKASPINYRLYRKALAAEMTIEGRFYGGLKGVYRLLTALTYAPRYRQAWMSLLELFWRGIKKGLPR